MRLFSFFVLLAVVLSSCVQKELFTPEVNAIKEIDYQKTIDGEEVRLYTLKGKNNIGIKVTNYGARIVALCVPDRSGNPVDVVCGYNSLDEYINNKEAYFGCVLGRYGNRISNGKFALEGKVYQLEVNNGLNALHGGSNGFHRRVWKANQVADNKIEFEYFSVDGEVGYPGNLTIKMSYELTDDDALKISYWATTDKTTILNLANHSYFNLSGEGNEVSTDHVVQINADYITEVDSNMVPTGHLLPVEGTVFDFNKPKVIAEQLDYGHTQISMAKGFDHNYVIKQNAELNSAAVVYSPLTGIQMEVITDQPGVQFYGGNFLNGSLIGKSGKSYMQRSAFCFETQHYADSPNRPEFPSTVLKAGEEYTNMCIYKFSVFK